MSKVRRLASFAKNTPIPRTKIEPPNAHHVRPAVPPKRAALNVPIAHLANLKTSPSASNAQLDLHKVTPIKVVVPNASKETKHPKKAAVFVRLATWANTIQWTGISAWHVPSASTKTAKGK